MARITRFEDLDCWKEARLLVKEIYEVAHREPLSKDYDLRSQLKRAALSIMNNTAEGFARRSDKEFIRFLDFSSASASEVKSMIYVLEDIEYLPAQQANVLHKKVDKVQNLTIGLLRYIKSKNTYSVKEVDSEYSINYFRSTN